MKITTVENARRVLFRAWSVWLAVLSAVFASIEVLHTDLMALLPVIQPYLAEKTAGGVAAILAALVPVARIIKQVSLEVERETKELDSD